MFKEGLWRVELKRNGRVRKIEFNNMILDDALNFHFDYSVNNTTASIITHMFLSTAHTDIKGNDTAMGGVVVARLPYIDYIKPNFDNPSSNVFENTLVFRFNPTETVVVRQFGTGRVNGSSDRFFSIANILDETGARAELTLKPGDELTMTYVLTSIGHILEADPGANGDVLDSRAQLNNILKANPNWGLAGYQRQINVMAAVVSEHLGTPVTGKFTYVYAYDYTSDITGSPVRRPLYSISWTAEAGKLATVPADKWRTTFFPGIAFPFSRYNRDTVGPTPPTGDVWTYNQQFWVTPGASAIDRFDHTHKAAILKPKIPDSYAHTLIESSYNYPASDNFAKWSIEIKGCDPLAQVAIIQNGRIAIPRPVGLQFVNKQGVFKAEYKITEIRQDQPFYVHFWNRAGLTKYGPLFVKDPITVPLRGTIKNPVVNKGDPQSAYYYNIDSSAGIWVQAAGRVTNDEDRKSILWMLVDDYNTPDNPELYLSATNEYDRTNRWYQLMPRDFDRTIEQLIANPDSRIRLRMAKDGAEFYEMPIVFPEIIPGTPQRQYLGTFPGYEVLQAQVKIKKV